MVAWRRAGAPPAEPLFAGVRAWRPAGRPGGVPHDPDLRVGQRGRQPAGHGDRGRSQRRKGGGHTLLSETSLTHKTH